MLLVTFRLRLHEFRANSVPFGTVPNWIVVSESIWYRIGSGSARSYKRKAYWYQFRTCSEWIRSGVNASLDIVMYDVKTARS